jgi:aromatic ring-opening dioxygenase catalytic subunit (LigB family)
MHWISNFRFHFNANARHKGVYTSHEAPHLIQDMAYDYRGNPDLSDMIAAEARKADLDVLSHKVATLPLEYGTIVPMHYMNEDGAVRVLAAASPIFATVDDNRRFGEAARMLPDYTTKCSGEALMADTAMLFGLLGWEKYDGKAEQLCDYFPSSGSGQVNVEFHVA